MTEDFNIDESGDIYMVEERFFPGALISGKNFKNTCPLLSRKATRKSVLKAVKIRPQIPKIVLDSLKEKNALSIDDISVYIAENYGAHVKMLKNSIRTFLTKAEKTGLIEKAIGADTEEKFSIKDEEKVQIFIQDLISDIQKEGLMKNAPAQKTQRRQGRSRREKKMYKKNSENNEDREKHNSIIKGKTNTNKQMTEISKINQLEDVSTVRKELLDLKSTAKETNSFTKIFKNADTLLRQKATRKSVLKAVKIRPQVPKIVLDSLKEKNALSVDHISVYISEKYGAYAKMLKNAVCTFLRKAEKAGFIQKVIGTDAEEKFIIKDEEKVQKYIQDLILNIKKAELMKNAPVQKMQRRQGRSRRERKMYKKNRENNEDRKKHYSIIKGKTNTNKQITEISKINQLEDVSTVRKELLDLKSTAKESNSFTKIFKNAGAQFHQKATRKSVLRAVEIRPQVPKIVLDSLKEKNALSVDDIRVYIAEKYGAYAKLLKNAVRTFLWKAEKAGLIQKIIGADAKRKFIIKDEEKVQIYVQNLILDAQNAELVKNMPMQKKHQKQGRSRRQKETYKEKRENNEDSKKHKSIIKRKTNTNKKMTEISKINQLQDASTVEKELLHVKSTVNEINSFTFIEQKATKPIDIRPFIQKMFFESLKTLKKHNGMSVEEISAYIGEHNGIDIKIVKSVINNFLKKGVERGIFEKVVGANTEERFRFKKGGENKNCKHNLVSMKRKAESMKIGRQRRRIKRRLGETYKKRKNTKNKVNRECSGKIHGKENIIKVMTENSMLVKSDNMALIEEKSISVESHLFKHQRAKRNIVKKPVAVRSQVPKIVLEILVLEERNALSVDEIGHCMAEKYRVYLKMLHNCIYTFLTKAEETGLVEKVSEANAEEKFKIKDVEKVQKYLQDLVSKKQELKIMKDIQKKQGKQRRKVKQNKAKISENGADTEKNSAEPNSKENPMTKAQISKMKKSDDISISQKGLLVASTSVPASISGKLITKQNATEKSAIESVETRPLLQKIILEAFKALKKSNGVSVEQIVSFIGEKYEFNVRKFVIEEFIRRGVKHGAFEKVDEISAEEIFKIKKAEKEDKCQGLVSRKRKVELMKTGENKKVPYSETERVK